GERPRRSERSENADRVQRPALPDLGDEGQPDESQAERKPDAPPDGPMQHVARPEGDDQRREVLDQERDPDREPVDGEEVEPLDERHAADAERDEKRELGPSEPQGGG